MKRIRPSASRCLVAIGLASAFVIAGLTNDMSPGLSFIAGVVVLLACWPSSEVRVEPDSASQKGTDSDRSN